ncbi:hypothetical protein [Erwinia mallotivora]|uniref:Uncharacterized protein n=1 Tax=Erwinia mallotivora TaxID=69222 RepID=A0A014NPX9_9GAMM|nr:hypothetical protein [Erwinia mallotivora]EXU75875.1 hypothetical protein BG55_08875 [Erwinia mallotivora]
MRELTFQEVTCVSGAGEDGGSLIATGALGLLVSIPVIVVGAILGIPTLGLGFVAMAAGIVGTALSGVAIISGIVQSSSS